MRKFVALIVLIALTTSCGTLEFDREERYKKEINNLEYKYERKVADNNELHLENKELRKLKNQ